MEVQRCWTRRKVNRGFLWMVAYQVTDVLFSCIGFCTFQKQKTNTHMLLL